MLVGLTRTIRSSHRQRIGEAVTIRRSALVTNV
jgi:hypothetical protein